MTQHLTEDQISRWLAGQSNALEQSHVETCRSCAAELDGFRGTLDSFRAAITERAEWLTQNSSPERMQVLAEHPWTLLESPSLLSSLKRALLDTLYPAKTSTSAALVDVKDLWSPRQDLRLARRLSLGVHAAIVALLILPAVISGPHFSTPTLVALYDKTVPLIVNKLPEGHSGGGGGGGRKALTPPSKGEPPRGADKQLVPPMVDVKNLAPDLVVESTIVAPALDSLKTLNVQIGDPNGIVGPPSPGPGKGGGIGTGEGTGVGPGKGPGLGPGEGGNTGGGLAAFTPGGGVSMPRLVSQIQPEYSDDARRARIQGTVELLIIVRADGTVQMSSVQTSLGYGLDQKAIEAVRQWKFTPGKKDGVAVPTWMQVSINFTLR